MRRQVAHSARWHAYANVRVPSSLGECLVIVDDENGDTMNMDGKVAHWHGVTLQWNESDEDGYTADGYRGVAWRIIGREMQETPDTEWDGIYEPTGHIIACMVGDDRPFSFDPDELTRIADEDYCAGCGQIGCQAYG